MRHLLIAVVVGLLASHAHARSPEALATVMAQVKGGQPSAELSAAIDREAAQKDAWTSGLFWYTDLNEAVTAAKAAGKPILSLRLLGRLDEEMSCANSRFFRKMLYSDPTIGRLLRSEYILHWESVRPVPIVTIDFGQGTTVKRTLTGNSLHYLMSPDGQIIDALPGMIDAGTFAREIETFATTFRGKHDATTLAGYYDATINRLKDTPAAPAKPLAMRAMRETASKAFIQSPVLASVKNPSEYVKQDTLHNQSMLRPQIIAWLRVTPNPDVKPFTDRIYADLFFTPLNDPYMGLGLPDEAALFERTPISLSPAVEK